MEIYCIVKLYKYIFNEILLTSIWVTSLGFLNQRQDYTCCVNKINAPNLIINLEVLEVPKHLLTCQGQNTHTHPDPHHTDLEFI